MSEKVLDLYKKRHCIFRWLYYGGMAVSFIPLLLGILIYGTASEAGIYGDITFITAVGGILCTVVSLYLGLYWTAEEVGKSIAEADERRIAEIVKKVLESERR